RPGRAPRARPLRLGAGRPGRRRRAPWDGRRIARAGRAARAGGRVLRRPPAGRRRPLTPTRVTGGATVGVLLRDWRRRRRLTQLALALSAGVSTRHLSFVETGRARPSAELILQLADHLDVPLRERNAMLLAAGYAPAFPTHSLEAPEMGPVRD